MYSPLAVAQIPAPRHRGMLSDGKHIFENTRNVFKTHTHEDAREEGELKDWSVGRVDTNHEQLSG